MAEKIQTLVSILKSEVVPALGCTEPVAVALASAWAARAAGGVPESVAVTVDKNVYKNGLCVGVPGTGETGLHIAAAVGALAGDPLLRLEVLRPIGEAHVRNGKEMIAKNRVRVQVDLKSRDVSITALVRAGSTEGRAEIQGRHDRVVSVTRNGETFEPFGWRKDSVEAEVKGEDSGQDSPDSIQDFTLADIFHFIQTVPLSGIEFLGQAVKINTAFARESMTRRELVGVGAKIQSLMSKGLLSDDWVGKAKRWVASSVEARMAGMNMAVMSCAGSGNQGLISILPAVVAAGQVGADEERLLRATALSCLVTVYVKSFMGILTPVCGGNVAGGMGACCAVAYLFGGGMADIERAVKNMAGSVMGVICDGAKIGCALKSTMAVSVAVDNALLALEGVTVPAGDGIVDESADRTIRNMGFVTAPGMNHTDDAILRVMGGLHP